MPDGSITSERARLDRPAVEREPVDRQDTGQSTSTVESGDRRSSRGRRWLRWLLILAAVVVLVVGGGYYWLSGGRYVTTTDAYVQANVLDVATDVPGIVATIPVKDGEHVKAGQILFTLNPLRFQLAVDDARAAVEQAKLDLNSLKAEYTRSQQMRAAQEAQVRADQATFDRYAALVKSHAMSQQEYDNARFKLQADQAQLGSIQASAKSTLARLGGNAELPVAQAPAYKTAEAKLGEAERDLNRATVRAPFDGVVTQVPKLQIGQFLPAGNAAFGLVGDDQFWVLAEPKETALTHARPGQTATVTIDAYPSVTWHGTVASIAPATDQEFSLLPAQNSSGNWVKVVQRVPVKVNLKPVAGAPPLSAGMSAEVTIDTHHQRHLSDLF